MARVYHTGEQVPHNGVYRVHHRAHRLPQEVTLLAGQSFPPCAKCKTKVSFELVAAAPLPSRRGRAILWSIPELGDNSEEAA